MIVVQHTQQQQQQQPKKIVYYQKTEIFKNFLYFLKIEIIVHLIEKANIFLYSLKTDVGMGEGGGFWPPCIKSTTQTLQ